MGLRQTVAPAIEPLTLAEAKHAVRLDEDITQDDLWLTGAIAAAREQAERITARQLLTATWELTLDGFCDPTWCYYDCRLSAWVIRVPKPRLLTVVSLTYLDGNGDTQTLTVEDHYQVDVKDEPGRVYPAYGVSWPAARLQANSVTLTYTAGYGNAASYVPEGIKIAMKLMLDDWYNGRTGAKGAIGDVPECAENILRGYWHGAMP